MLSGRALACSLLILLTSVVGCKRDLGDCNLDGQTPDGVPIDGPAAFDIAYRITDGLPMYEGQALVQSTCGDGAFCHSPAAVGADRIGVPAQLDFDVGLACNEAADAACASPPSCEGGQTDTYCQRLRRLHGNQSNIRDWAEGMIQEMRASAMPPGEAGRRVRNSTPWLRESDGSELPPIESGEAREIVRNWLACQAPVVARTEIPPSVQEELQPCPSVDDEICIYTGPQGELPEPAWSEIYWSIMFTTCVGCHGPSNNNVDQNPNNPLGGDIPGGASAPALEALNLTGSDTTDTTDWASESWSAVVNVSAYTGGVCAAQGTLVIPNDSPNSLMIEKMRDTQVCGTVMPPTGSIAGSLIQVVEDWIDMGAQNN
ncbi:MAG: hypothetical protein JSU89_08930 [Myxococcales bacterium]|nr:MAG: hypothetical protein JSU89_08930 [Myxococcales bacterium]